MRHEKWFSERFRAAAIRRNLLVASCAVQHARPALLFVPGNRSSSHAWAWTQWRRAMLWTGRFVSRGLGLSIGLTLAVLGLAWGMSPSAAAETFPQVEEFGGNPGRLDMFKYVPAALPPNSPLVVVLHGGHQSAATNAWAAGWPEMARRCGFALLLPQQRTMNNPTFHFNWFVLKDCWPNQTTPIALQEAESIIHMIDQIRHADRSRVGRETRRNTERLRLRCRHLLDPPHRPVLGTVRRRTLAAYPKYVTTFSRGCFLGPVADLAG